MEGGAKVETWAWLAEVTLCNEEAQATMKDQEAKAES